jgi:hypothetical protein
MPHDPDSVILYLHEELTYRVLTTPFLGVLPPSKPYLLHQIEHQRTENSVRALPAFHFVTAGQTVQVLLSTSPLQYNHPTYRHHLCPSHTLRTNDDSAQTFPVQELEPTDHAHRGSPEV